MSAAHKATTAPERRAGVALGAAETTLLLVEDDAIVRDWVRLALDGSVFRLAGEAADAAEAIGLVERRRPELLLIDYRLPDRSGAELVHELRTRGFTAPALLMSANPIPGLNEIAHEAGAQGTLVKTGSLGALEAAIRAIANGHPSFDARHPRRPGDRPRLSPRERETLRLIAGGATNRQIARQLGIGEETIKTVCARAFGKLGAHKRAEAVAAAQRHGLL